MISVLGASLLFSLLAVPAYAQIRLDLPAQALGQSLTAVGTLGHLNVMFDPSIVDGLQAPALKAELSADDALGKLLSGTRLHTVRVDAHTIRVVADPVAKRAQTTRASETHARYAPAGVHLASATSDDGLPDGVADTSVSDPSTPPPKSEREGKAYLEEVVVTGSRLVTPQSPGPAEVQVYSREVIDQSGQTAISDFLNTLSSVSVNTTSNYLQSPGGQGTVNLHGLPFGTTLVLINGRRVETSGTQSLSGFDFFDLNNIPLASVERIEVVPSGSSAIYGSDAVAGVVNIILKRDFAGVEANVRHGAADDTSESDFSLGAGRQWSSGGISAITSYQTSSGLTTNQRFLTASNDYTAFGGPNGNYPVCSPGNVFSVDGTPLPGAPTGTNAAYAAVSPVPAAGKPPLTNFQYGRLNECSILSGTSIIPEISRAAVFLQGHYQLTDSVEIFGELMYSRAHQYINEGAQLLFGIPGYQQYTVSPSNPFNPFGRTVGIAELLPSESAILDYDTSFFRPLIGARGTLPGRWQWEVSTWQSGDRTALTTQNQIVNSAAIQSALNSSDPSVALNPFVPGLPGSPSALQSFFSSGFVRYSGRDQSVSGYIRGPAVTLPAGPVQIVAGGEIDRSRLYSDLVNDGTNSPNTQEAFHRRIYAAFVETRLPILASRDRERTLERAVITLAGRHDHYSDFGSKNTPQVGLELRPFASLLVRGTYADTFKAPPLPDLYAPVIGNPNGAIVDPITGQHAIVTILNGGNARLHPITGNSYTFGITYSSQAIDGLNLSVTDWTVKEKSAIQDVSAQFIADNQGLFPGRVSRDAAGNITSVDATKINFGSLRVSGVDYQVSYRRDTKFGVFTPSVVATQTYSYVDSILPGAPSVDAVSKAQGSNDWAPRWKATVSVAWNTGPYSGNVAGRFVGPYQDYDGAREIGDFWIWDANVRLKIGSVVAPERSLLNGLNLEIGAINLFNRLPQFSAYMSGLLGYDPAEADIRGRLVYGRVGFRW